MWRTSVLLFCSCVLFLPGPASGEPLDDWRWRNPLPTGATLRDAAFGGGVHVIVGDGGTILASNDTVSWTPRPSGTTDDLRGIAWGLGRFVAVGEKGVVLSSPDGTTWDRVSYPYADDFAAILQANDLFVAVGDSTIMTTDGVSYQRFHDPAFTELRGIAWGDGRFVAVGFRETWGAPYTPPSIDAVAVTSASGDSWTAREFPIDDRLVDVAFGNGSFVVIGSFFLHTSVDGLEWTSSRWDGFPNPWAGRIARGSGRFVMAAAETTGTGFLATSTDGTTWTTPYYSDNELYSADFVDGLWLAVGSAGLVLTSADGLEWTRRTIGFSGNFLDALYAEKTFVGVGTGGMIMTSPDGVNWRKRASRTSRTLNAITHGGGIFVAVGEGGVVLRSPDGRRWSRASSGTRADLLSVTYGNRHFVAAGRRGTIISSSGGVRWVRSSSPFPLHWPIPRVTYGGGTFVAVGASIASSSDGSTWTRRAPLIQIECHYNEIEFGGGNFVATSTWLAGCGFSRASQGGTEWRRTELPEGYRLAYGNRTFVAVRDGQFLLSSDGRDWSRVREATELADADNLRFVAGNFLAWGRYLATSIDGKAWRWRGKPGAVFTKAVHGANSIVLFGEGGTVYQSAPLD